MVEYKTFKYTQIDNGWKIDEVEAVPVEFIKDCIVKENVWKFDNDTLLSLINAWEENK